MNLGCSSEKTDTSSSATETKKIPSHVVNLKESKTHLFYVIQSDNESNARSQHLVELKISKEISSSRKSVTKKMRLRYGNSSDDITDENRVRAKRTQIPSRLASIHKRTDHPSFVVLPQVLSRRHLNVRQNVENNQSTSENSNETYVIRSKADNKIWGNKGKMPMLFGSLRKRNAETADATFLHGLNNLVLNTKSEGYCDCDKDTAKKLNLEDKIGTVGSAQNTSKGYLKKEDLFNIDFAKPTQDDMPKRLRAGQDYDRRYKSCYMCPNMTRIFPPTSSRRPTAFQADSGSNSTLNNRSGYAKINFKLVRQCLIHGSVNEKTEILDAIRLRMKSSESNVAIGTIEDIVKFDLFGVQCECRSKPLLEDLFWPLTPSYELQTSIAQFVNALVSYKLGRTYFNNRSVIRMLTWGDIGRDNIDPIMGDNLMGIMMKLSCSRYQRTDMIKNGLLRWLLQHMQEKEYSVSKYHLQCMTRLLRNLLRGYNLENLSPTEVQNMIVLLGRYLDHENETAKRYICDSLTTLFQNVNCVARAKDLNFQRVIQEHVTNAPNPAQREHLSAVHRLLNRSTSSTSFKTQKFDIRSEEETFLDADLEPGGEVDCYPGECLIREKFNDDAGVQRQEKTTDDSNASDKGGKLITRIFVEHLNCFLPNIENNRIFPLCNSRCADKIGTCSHVGDIQPKKRQPYIPPNSRLPRQKQSVGVSVEEVLEEDYNKSMRKSRPPDKVAKSIELMTSRVSTISHDTTAAKWNQIGKGDSDAKVPTSFSTDTGPMEKIFEGHSMKTNDALEGEHIIATESYHQESFGGADVLNERWKNDENKMEIVINDRLLDQQPDMEKVMNIDGQLAARTETTNREEPLRDPINSKSVEDLELTEGQKISEISGALTQRTSSPMRSKHGLDSAVSEQEKEKLNELSTQKTLQSDVEGRRKLPVSSSFDSNDNGQRHLFEDARLKDTLVDQDMQTGESSKIKKMDQQLFSSKFASRPLTRHSSESTISQQGMSERRQVPRTNGIKTGRGIHTKSEETFTNLARDEKSSNMNEVTETTQERRHFPVRSKEIVVKTRIDQDPLLNAKSEGFMKKISNETGIILKVRSEEGVRNPKSRVDKAQDVESANQKLDPALQVRSETILVQTTTGKIMRHVKSNENPVSDAQIAPQLHVRSANMLGATQGLMPGISEDTMAQRHPNIDADETGNKLNARSQNLLTKQVETLPSSLIESRRAKADIVTQQMRTSKLHARSMEMLKKHESSHQLIRKSKSDVGNIDAQHPSGSPPSPNVGRKLQARSVEYEKTNYHLLKSSSDDLLGSTRNQDFSLEPTGNDNWINKTKLLNQFAVRSNELIKHIGKTQSASSNYRLNSSGIDSKHCVDCRGSGYVLRARPSQPCDTCKDSLSKYPNFVDALADVEHQRRDVTRTGKEWIKITLVNKSGEKLNSKSNEETPNKEKLSKSVGENSEKAKGNADSVEGSSGTTQKQKPTEMSEDQLTESVEDCEGDAMVGSIKHSLDDKSNVICTRKNMASTVAMKTAENVVTNEVDRSVTQKLLLRDGIKEIVPTSSVHKKLVDCTENASSVRPQSAKLIHKDNEDEKSQPTSDDNTIDNLPIATATCHFQETTRHNLMGQHDPVETDSNQLLHLIPKRTEASKSTKQVDEKDDEVAVHQLEESKNGSSEVECKDSNRTASIEEVTDSGHDQFITPGSGNEPSQTATNVNEKVEETKKSELPVPDSVNLLQDTTLGTLVGTKKERTATGSTTSNQSSKEETPVAVNVADRGKLNVSANIINTSDDNHFRQAVNDQQLSEKRLYSPVAVHLCPRSTEINNTDVMRSRPVDNVKGFKALDESENSLEKSLDSKGPTSELVDENNGPEDIEFKGKGQLTSTTNTKSNNSPNVAEHAKPEDEKRGNESITVETQDYQKSEEQQNNRRDNQIPLNTPCTTARSVEAVSGEYPVSLAVQSNEPMNDEKPDAEAAVPVDVVLPTGSIKNVRNDVALVPQDNEMAVSEPLKNEYPNEAVGVTDDPVLPVRSKQDVTEISGSHNNRNPLSTSLKKQDEQNKEKDLPVSLDLVNVENVVRKTTKPSLFPPRSNDLVVTNNASPIRNQKPDETRTVKQNDNLRTKKEETVSGEGSHKESSNISVRKPIDNKSSTVLDEALVEVQNLRSPKSTKLDMPEGTEIDQELSLEGFGYFSDGIIEKGRRKVRTVNSTCCRQLLNNEELINRLTEKVLEKLTNKIHRCGPNCKSPCGGFNSYLKAHKDNNLNWE